MTIGEKIYAYRVKHDLSMRAMAEKCHISLQTLMYVEKGLQEPSKFTIDKIELVLKED